MIPNELTLVLSDKDGQVNLDLLIETLENALALLRGFTSEVIASGLDIRWQVVRVKMNSPLRMTLAPLVRRNEGKGRPNKTIGRKIVKAALDSMDKLERGAPLPSSFSPESVDAARRLLRATSSEGAALSFESPLAHKVRLTEKSVKHLEEISSKGRLYVDHSTIEGRLEAASVHNQNTFSVWESLTGHRVECVVSEEQMRDVSDYLGKRVSVSGRVTYRNHVPKSIAVEGPIKVLRSSAELPQPGDIGPVDITGGIPSEEFVRRLRNG